MVLNATFNNISVISWRSVLLVEETGVPGENYRPDQLYHILLHQVHLAMSGILITLVVISTDCTVSCKSHDHDHGRLLMSMVINTTILWTNPNHVCLFGCMWSMEV